MATESVNRGIQTWTSVDMTAMNIGSRPVSLSYRNAVDEVLEDIESNGPGSLSLNKLMNLSRRSRSFRALQAGSRIIIEIHDQNPVKTISARHEKA